MTWGLFFQIEVIVLTIGLVGAFLIGMNYSVKESNFNKKMDILGDLLNTIANNLKDQQEKKYDK